MKNHTPVQDKDFEVFIPLINLFLFNSSGYPKFKSNSENLSTSYNLAQEFDKQHPIEENGFYLNILYTFLVDLDDIQRNSISNIILKNDGYLAGMSRIYAIDNECLNGDSDTIFEENILPDLISFNKSGTFNKNILLYLIFHFENIFDFEFSNTKIITKEQYDNLIEQLCATKDFKYGFNLTV